MKGNMKRLLAIFLVLVMLSADVCAFAEAVATLKLPKALKIIEEEAFYGNTSIERVIVPDGTTEIRSRAFADSSMTEIELPDSLTFIAEDAFEGCGDVSVTAEHGTYAYTWAVENGFIQYTTSPRSFTYSIADEQVTIKKYNGSDAEVVIPPVIEGYPVKEIAMEAFSRNNNIKSVVVSEGIEKIGHNAFWVCKNLETLVLPASLKDMTATALTNCSALHDLQVSPDNPIYSVVDDVLYGDSGKKVVWYYAAKEETSFAIPDGVTSIGDNAFSSAVNLAAISIPETVESIGYGAFFGCSGLKTLVLPEGLTELPDSMVSGCTSLENVVVPESVTYIAGNVFRNCSSLTSVTLPKTAMALGVGLFYGCSNLESVIIPEGVKYLHSGMFDLCSSLSSITIPDSVISINEGTFDDCSDELVIYGNNGTYAQEYAAKNGIAFAEIAPEDPNAGFQYSILNGEVTITGYTGSESEVAVPAELEGYPVTAIGEAAFKDNTVLTAISFEEGIKEIGVSAFENTGLTEIDLPDGCEQILDRAFAGSAVKETFIPESMAYIADNAFEGCPIEQWIVDEVFGYAFHWGYDHEMPVYFALYTFGDYKLAKSQEYGKGYMIYRYLGEEEHIEIPDEYNGRPINEIGTEVFLDHTQLKSVEIPENIVMVAFGAFSGCTGLTEVILPESVSSIGGEAFARCSNLKKVYIPENVKEMYYDIFMDCSEELEVYGEAFSCAEMYAADYGLKFVAEHNGYTPLSDINIWCNDEECLMHSFLCADRTAALSGYHWRIEEEKPEVLNISETVADHRITRVSQWAFGNEEVLKEIYLPDSIEVIEDYAFYYCDNLMEIGLPENLETIGEEAFSGCYDLSKIVIPESVQSIEDSAFADMDEAFIIYGYEGSCAETYALENGIRFKPVGSPEDTPAPTPTPKPTPEPDAAPAEDFEYWDYGDEVWITAYIGSDTDVKIPSVINEGKVIYIYEDAFRSNEELMNVTIPDTVTAIGGYAFADCSNLTCIEIPNSVTWIGGQAFTGCSSLESVILSNSLESVDSDAFYKCDSLKEVYVDSIEGWLAIEFSSFYSNPMYYAEDLYIAGERVTAIDIPNSVTSIGYAAFAGCSNLTSISIPDSVTSIGQHAFEDCSNLMSINIPNSIESIDEEVFWGCSSLMSITIPDSVISIGAYAFAECSSLTNIDIPDSVTSIGAHAFIGCSSLTDVDISDSVTSIGRYTFSGCSGLTSINIPNSVTSIGRYTFSECSSLTDINIPNSVTSIGECAFYGCSGLTDIDIPDSVTSIGDYAFVECSSLTSIVIPDSVTDIGNSAFSLCSSLTSIVLPEYVTIWGDFDFSDHQNLTSVKIPASVIITGRFDFSHCSSLVDISLPRSRTSIAEYAFWGCSSLRNIVIPDTVTSIGYRAFWGCSSLEEIEIPNSVTSIGEYAFAECSSLEEIQIPDSVTSIGKYTFAECSSLEEIQIPDSVTSIGEYAFAECSSLREVEIPKSVTSISDFTFYRCFGMRNIIIPESVTSIGIQAFDNCDSLIDIEIPDSVVSIGEAAFFGCDRLSSFTFPDSVTSISKSVLGSNGNLVSITIPESVISIGDYAFRDCDSLRKIVIPDSVMEIGYSVFRDCDSLNDVTLPSFITNLDDGIFAHCDQLESIKIPNYVTRIGVEAFSNCPSLTSMAIPDSVTRIGAQAFMNCRNLVAMTLPNHPITFEFSVFDDSDKIIIYGTKGSYAEFYANEYGIPFVVGEIPGVVPTPTPSDTYVIVSGYKINNTPTEITVKEGDTLTFSGTLTPTVGATISAVQVSIYDTAVEPLGKSGAQYFREAGLTKETYDLSCVNGVKVGEEFGEVGEDKPKHTMTAGNTYAVMLYARDSKGNSLEDIDPNMAEYQGPMILVHVESNGFATLSGFVTDTAGNPLSGVAVTVYEGDTTNYPFGSTTTNSTGAWSVSNVKVGSYYGVGFEKEGYTFSPALTGFTVVDGGNRVPTAVGTPVGQAVSKLTLSVETWNCAAASSVRSVTVESDAAWEITSKPDWLNVYQANEVEAASAMYTMLRAASVETDTDIDDNFLLITKDNEDTDSRSGEVIVTNGGTRKTIKVVQSGRGATLANGGTYTILSPVEGAEYSRAETSIDIECSTAARAKIEVFCNGETQLSFTSSLPIRQTFATQNIGAYTMNVVFFDYFGKELTQADGTVANPSVQFTVKEPDDPYYDLIQTFTFGTNGGSQSVAFENVAEMGIDFGEDTMPDWLTLTYPQLGSLKITAAANDTGLDRETEFTVITDLGRKVLTILQNGSDDLPMSIVGSSLAPKGVVGGKLVYGVLASGGAGNYRYTFDLIRDGIAYDSVTQSSNILIYEVTESGTYQVVCKATDGTGKSATVMSTTSLFGGHNIEFVTPEGDGYIYQLSMLPIVRWRALSTAVRYGVKVYNETNGAYLTSFGGDGSYFDCEDQLKLALSGYSGEFTENCNYRIEVAGWDEDDTRVVSSSILMSVGTTQEIEILSPAAGGAVSTSSDVVISWNSSGTSAQYYALSVKHNNKELSYTANNAQYIGSAQSSFSIPKTELSGAGAYTAYLKALSANGTCLAQDSVTFYVIASANMYTYGLNSKDAADETVTDVGRLTQVFADPTDDHIAIDFKVTQNDETGEPAIRAIADGVVVGYSEKASNDNGICITLKHEIGGYTYYSFYGHLERLDVKEGSVVAGQKLGKMGNTGYSTGPHVHLSVFAGPKSTDPFGYKRDSFNEFVDNKYIDQVINKDTVRRYYNPCWVFETNGQCILENYPNVDVTISKAMLHSAAIYPVDAGDETNQAYVTDYAFGIVSSPQTEYISLSTGNLQHFKSWREGEEGVICEIDPETNNKIWTIQHGKFTDAGERVFTFTASDGSAWGNSVDVSITINPQKPMIVEGSVSTAPQTLTTSEQVTVYFQTTADIPMVQIYANDASKEQGADYYVTTLGPTRTNDGVTVSGIENVSAKATNYAMVDGKATYQYWQWEATFCPLPGTFPVQDSNMVKYRVVSCDGNGKAVNSSLSLNSVIVEKTDLPSHEQMVANLVASGIAGGKTDAVKYAAEMLFADNKEAQFVAGVCGNIILEADIGQFETDWKTTSQPYLPSRMSGNPYKYDTVYGGKYIYNGFKLSEVSALAETLQTDPDLYYINAEGKKRRYGFGLGCVQWSFDRTVTLLDYYEEEAGKGNDVISRKQCIEAELKFMKAEINGSHDAAYNNWKNGLHKDEYPDEAARAGFCFATYYEVCKVSERPKRAAKAAEVYQAMLGDANSGSGDSGSDGGSGDSGNDDMACVLDVSPNQWQLGSYAANKEFTITYDSAWSINRLEEEENKLTDWLLFDISRDAGVLTLKATENGGAQRECDVVISCNEHGTSKTIHVVQNEKGNVGVLGYAQYNGVDYTATLKQLLNNDTISQTEYNNRMSLLEEAKKICTVIWTPPVTFHTWQSGDGEYNNNEDMVYSGTPSNYEFCVNVQYVGIPYVMRYEHNTYDVEAWDAKLKTDVQASDYEGWVDSVRTHSTLDGIDCGGLVVLAYHTFDTTFTHDTTTNWTTAPYLSKTTSPIPGDLILKPKHVMIYLGKTASGEIAVFEAVASDPNYNGKCSGSRYYEYSSVSGYDYYEYSKIDK